MQVSKIKTIVYWFTTGLLALDLLAGGTASLLRSAQVLSTIQHLGYPAYFASILGFRKLLGGFALLVPGGICFDLTSAAISHAASGDGAPEAIGVRENWTAKPLVTKPRKRSALCAARGQYVYV
jgi:hypothetical protein